MSDISDVIDDYLALHHRIAIIWAVEDVLELRPDLSEQQAWEVLQAAEESHNPDQGIAWDLLAFIAEELFGCCPDADADQEE